jgi:hypothetical protein
LRIAQHHSANRLDIAAPDSVSHAARSDEAGPIGKATTTRKNELRIGKPNRCGINEFGLMLPEIDNSVWIAATNGV